MSSETDWSERAMFSPAETRLGRIRYNLVRGYPVAPSIKDAIWLCDVIERMNGLIQDASEACEETFMGTFAEHRHQTNDAALGHRDGA